MKDGKYTGLITIVLNYNSLDYSVQLSEYKKLQCVKDKAYNLFYPIKTDIKLKYNNKDLSKFMDQSIGLLFSKKNYVRIKVEKVMAPKGKGKGKNNKLANKSNIKTGNSFEASNIYDNSYTRTAGNERGKSADVRNNYLATENDDHKNYNYEGGNDLFPNKKKNIKNENKSLPPIKKGKGTKDYENDNILYNKINNNNSKNTSQKNSNTTSKVMNKNKTTSEPNLNNNLKNSTKSKNSNNNYNNNLYQNQGDDMFGAGVEDYNEEIAKNPFADDNVNQYEKYNNPGGYDYNNIHESQNKMTPQNQVKPKESQPQPQLQPQPQPQPQNNPVLPKNGVNQVNNMEIPKTYDDYEEVEVEEGEEGGEGGEAAAQ